MACLTKLTDALGGDKEAPQVCGVNGQLEEGQEAARRNMELGTCPWEDGSGNLTVRCWINLNLAVAKGKVTTR